MFKVVAIVITISFNLELINCIECGACGVENSVNRIVHGTQVAPNKYPWMVYLDITMYNLTSGGKRCGGAIINEKTIITAAHCLYGEVTKIRVLVGQNNRQMMNLESFYATPKGIVIHKQYDRNNVASEYDIALLNLERPLNFTNKIRPICMPKKGDIATGNFTVAGWGKTESSASSTVLLEAKVKEMDISGCKAFFKNLSNLTLVDDKHICAGSEKSGTCFGDSGGPLTQFRNGRHILDGLVSFLAHNHLAECVDTTKQVYVRTEYFLDWITKNSVAGEVCNK